MTDAVGIAGLIVGAVGSAAGIGALVYAHFAYSNAKASGSTADNSKRLAEKANDLARQSNIIAADARQLAEEANDTRRRGEAREIERHDVHWDGDWDAGQPGRYLLYKRGNADAHNVVATVTYGGESKTAQRDIMEGDDRVLTFFFDEALRDYQTEYRDRETRIDPYGMAMSLPYSINEFVQWNTELGAQKTHDNNSFITFDVYWG